MLGPTSARCPLWGCLSQPASSFLAATTNALFGANFLVLLIVAVNDKTETGIKTAIEARCCLLFLLQPSYRDIFLLQNLLLLLKILHHHNNYDQNLRFTVIVTVGTSLLLLPPVLVLVL
jgi:hypothetical protein